MFKIVIPEKAKQIINQLEQAGYEAYVVGGPVRDCILGKCPTDWDITTSASPYQVKEIFFIYDRYGNCSRYGDSHDGKRTI